MSAAEVPNVATAASAMRTRTPTALTPSRGVDVAIAVVAVVPPMICLIAVGGFPDQWSEWAALLGIAAAGAAVLTHRRHVLLGLALVTIAVLCEPAAAQIYQLSTSSLAAFLSLTELIAVGVVYCAVGSAMDLRASLLALAAAVGLSLVALGFDVPFLMIALGWWFVGRLLRSRLAVAEKLRIRAAELSAERDRYTAEAVRLERTKIARELHDTVAHCMTVIVIQSRAGRHLLDSDPAAAKEALGVIVSVAAEAEADIGALVELMDPPLTRSLLDELVTRASATGTMVTAEIAGDPTDLDPACAVVAHRVVQESITNAFRHAPGAAIRIELTGGPVCTLGVTNGPSVLGATNGTSVLSPTRTGIPLDAHDAPIEPEDDAPGTWGSGRGLLGIRERVMGVGGEVSWGATPSGGWRVLARFPAHG